MKFILLIFLSFPSFAFGQIDYAKFIMQFDPINNLNISETQVRTLDLKN
jgi:hypothetical protein